MSQKAVTDVISGLVEANTLSGFSPISSTPIDPTEELNGYYTADGIFKEDQSIKNDVFDLTPGSVYRIEPCVVGAETTASYVFFDNNGGILFNKHSNTSFLFKASTALNKVALIKYGSKVPSISRITDYDSKLAINLNQSLLGVELTHNFTEYLEEFVFLTPIKAGTVVTSNIALRIQGSTQSGTLFYNLQPDVPYTLTFDAIHCNNMTSGAASLNLSVMGLIDDTNFKIQDLNDKIDVVDSKVEDLKSKFSFTESITGITKTTVANIKEYSTSSPYNFSTFSGTGTELDNFSDSFRFIKIVASGNSWMPSANATKVEVNFVDWNDDETQRTVLYSKTFNIQPLTSGVKRDIVLDWGEEIQPVAEHNLMIEIKFNSYALANSVSPNIASVTTPKINSRYWTKGSMGNTSNGDTSNVGSLVSTFLIFAKNISSEFVISPDLFDDESIETKKLKDTHEEAKGTNLCDPLKCHFGSGSGAIDRLTGKVVSGWGYGYSDYIYIDSNGVTCSSGAYVGGISMGQAVYDKNKVYRRGSTSYDTIEYQPGDAFVRFSFAAGTSAETAMINSGKDILPYAPFEGMKLVLNESIIPASVRNQKPVEEDIDIISLPDKLYAVVGDNLQLFFRGMIKHYNPYYYNILVTCSKGKQFNRYFEYKPTASDIGTTSFTITLRDFNGKKICKKTTQIITVPAGSNPSTPKHVLCFGDSLTGAGLWCAEAYRRLHDTSGDGTNYNPTGHGFTNILFKGKKQNGDCGYFGEGGWTWSSYIGRGTRAVRFFVDQSYTLTTGAKYSHNGSEYTIAENNSGAGNILCTGTGTPLGSGTLTKVSGSGANSIAFTSWVEDGSNPLYDPDAENETSFVKYANEYCGGQIDVVCTLLTWNGQSTFRTNWTALEEKMIIFIRTLHREFPNAKVKLMGIQIPDVNGGMGQAYGATGNTYADSFGMIMTALNMNDYYQEFANRDEFKSYVEFVNVSAQFDSEYLMPTTDTPVNNRSMITERIGQNGVHPWNNYNAIGDIIYRNLINELCQS